MTVKIVGSYIGHNGGDGIRIAGNPDVEISGGTIIEHNGGHGINVLDKANINVELGKMITSLGLQPDVDPEAFAKLLLELRETHSVEKRREVVKSSWVLSRLMEGVEAGAFMERLIMLPENPLVKGILGILFPG